MSEYPETAEGTLVVMVCRAKHLPNRRKLDKQSPYALLRINLVAKKTSAVFRGGQTPEWAQEIRFQLTRDRRPIMKLDVLDETKNDPTPIGGMEFDCARVFRDPANLQDSGKYILDGWYDLALHDKPAGRIYLEMTFYPTAPVLPPKLTHMEAELALLPELDDETFRHLAPAVPDRVMDSVFVDLVSSPPKDYFRLSNPERSAAKKLDLVFVEGPKKTGRLARLKDKFMAKEPISTLWESKPRSDDTSPPPEKIYEVHGPEDLHLFTSSQIFSLSLPSGSAMPASFNSVWDKDPVTGFELPQLPPHLPAPPPHRPASQSPQGPSSRPVLMVYSTLSYGLSPSRTSKTTLPPVPSPGTKRGRKPPKDLIEHQPVLIPFSADKFTLDNDPVSDFKYQVSPELPPHKADELDPQYYAPTPSEQFARSLRLQSGRVLPEDIRVDLNTSDTGYLGEGQFRADSKFSPSIFQRINDENDMASKPAVPPKIPRGLSEKEYYVLEKDNYLKDINGRRL